MADAAWTLVHAYDKATDTVVEMSVQESAVATMTVAVVRPGTPHERVGVQTRLTLFNGTQLFVTEAKAELDSVFKTKEP